MYPFDTEVESILLLLISRYVLKYPVLQIEIERQPEIKKRGYSLHKSTHHGFIVSNGRNFRLHQLALLFWPIGTRDIGDTISFCTTTYIVVLQAGCSTTACALTAADSVQLEAVTVARVYNIYRVNLGSMQSIDRCHGLLAF